MSPAEKLCQSMLATFGIMYATDQTAIAPNLAIAIGCLFGSPPTSPPPSSPTPAVASAKK